MLKETKWKFFFSDCAKYVMEEGLEFKITGDRGVATATASVLSCSKRLYEALCSEEVKLEQVKNILIEKKRASKKFSEATGLVWPF